MTEFTTPMPSEDDITLFLGGILGAIITGTIEDQIKK